MLFVALVAFAVSAYGGMLAATISHGPAPLPEVRPHPTCDERDVLETERQTALAEGEALVSGLRAEGHAPEPFLGESLEAEHRAALDAVAAPQSLAIFHCGEYPCVAVLKGDQADGIAAALGHAGLTVETVAADGWTAVAFVHADQPLPARAQPRMRALIGVVKGLVER